MKRCLPKVVILFTIILNSINSIAQSKPDTVYFDQQWKNTSRESATYYRVEVKDSSTYKVSDHYMSGTIQMIGSYSSLDPEIKEGYFKYYYDGGALEDEGFYKNNKRNGQWKYYYFSGQVRGTQNFKNGRMDGEFITYYMDGKIRRHEEYKDSVMLSGTCFDKTGKEIAYFPYQQQPKFNGDLYKFIGDNIHYPETDRMMDREGTAYVSFIIEKDGSISTVRVLRGVAGAPDLDEEAVRVVSLMPKWIPGMQDGVPVRVTYSIPIHFQLK